MKTENFIKTPKIGDVVKVHHRDGTSWSFGKVIKIYYKTKATKDGIINRQWVLLIPIDEHEQPDFYFDKHSEFAGTPKIHHKDKVVSGRNYYSDIYELKTY
jgi:hypothetical protein